MRFQFYFGGTSIAIDNSGSEYVSFKFSRTQGSKGLEHTLILTRKKVDAQNFHKSLSTNNAQKRKTWNQLIDQSCPKK